MRARTVAAAIISAALLLGGAVLLVGDDVKQEMKTAEIQPYTVSVEVQEQLEKIAQDLVVETDMTEQVASPTEDETSENTTETEPIQAYDTLPEETMHELISAAQTLTDAYPDAIGWLILPGTNVQYPLMQGEDNDFYLHHAYDGSNMNAGSVFLDCRCEKHLLNGINMVYGHNMKNGTMLAGLAEFEDTNYFHAHRYGWLATSDMLYRIDFFSLAHADCNDAIYDGSQSMTSWTIRLRGLSNLYEPIGYGEDDRFISLSTCTNANGNDRTILTGRLVMMTGGDIDS